MYQTNICKHEFCGRVARQTGIGEDLSEQSNLFILGRTYAYFTQNVVQSKRVKSVLHSRISSERLISYVSKRFDVIDRCCGMEINQHMEVLMFINMHQLIAWAKH